MVKSRIGNLVLHMYYFLFEIETARISEILFGVGFDSLVFIVLVNLY